jgi:hypothetical protein
MISRKSFSPFVFAVVMGALVFPGLPRQFSFPSAAYGHSGNSITNNDPPDPCEQSLTPPGNANGLHKRCEAMGIGGGAAKGDFNGDGFADLAVGVPYEDQNGIGSVGGVNVIYGSANGLTSTADQFIDETDFSQSYNTGDHFGWALAAGDFNGDGFADLAIGMPDWDFLDIKPNSGRVFVVNGSSSGLRVDLIDPNTFPNDTSFGGRAGAALVWADFNGDGVADLAIGSPDASVKGEGLLCSHVAFDVANAGRITVLYGSPTGLSQFGEQDFHQGGCGVAPFNDPSAVGDSLGDGDRFGSSLAAGDFNNDSFADLVVGVPFENLGLVGDKQDAGLIHVLRGTRGGLSNFPQISFGPGIAGAAETGDQFGRTLATGDFDGDGNDDIAVAEPFEDLSSNTKADAGAVIVLFGTGGFDLVTASNNLFISQASLPGENIEAGDRFGWALAVGDFDGDGKDDLAIGSPGEDVSSNTIKDAGLVSVLYGSPSGPSFTRVQEWIQNSTGLVHLDPSETGDQFGYALSAWDYDGNGRSDLAIGVPFEDVVSSSTGVVQIDAGAVNLIYGGTGGLNVTGRAPQFWTQDSPGINDIAQPGDRFGSALY